MTDFEVLTSSRFYLEIKLQDSNDLIDGYFMECKGFKRTQTAIEIAEVTAQRWGSAPARRGRVMRTKLPGNVKSENLTLRYGMTISPTMWKWFQAVEQGQWAKQVRNGDLTIYNQGGDIQARFRFLGAWPVSYRIGDVEASSSEFQIEELELAIDEFLRVQPDGNEYS